MVGTLKLLRQYIDSILIYRTAKAIKCWKKSFYFSFLPPWRWTSSCSKSSLCSCLFTHRRKQKTKKMLWPGDVVRTLFEAMCNDSPL